MGGQRKNEKPAEHLVETTIAKEIGASRAPFPEAFYSLEMEGLIESIPDVGHIVKDISEEEVGEICEITRATEQIGVGWATQKARESDRRNETKHLCLRRTD